MRRLVVFASMALLAAAPAVAGLAGNSSFSQDIVIAAPVGARTWVSPAAAPIPSSPARVSETVEDDEKADPSADSDRRNGRGSGRGSASDHGGGSTAGSGDDHGGTSGKGSGSGSGKGGGQDD